MDIIYLNEVRTIIFLTTWRKQKVGKLFLFVKYFGTIKDTVEVLSVPKKERVT